MKKIVSLVLTLALLTVTCGALAEFELTPFRDDVFEIIGEDDDDDVIIIQTSGKPVYFSHAYECDYSSSELNNGIIVVGPDSKDPQAVFFTRFAIHTTQEMDITDIVFILDGKKYTLPDISDKDNVEKTNDGYEQDLNILYGSNNTELFRALCDGAIAYVEHLNDEEGTAIPSGTILLHGIEDITVEMDENFWVDLTVMLMGILDQEDPSWVLDYDGNDCIVRDVK